MFTYLCGEEHGLVSGFCEIVDGFELYPESIVVGFGYGVAHLGADISVGCIFNVHSPGIGTFESDASAFCRCIDDEFRMEAVSVQYVECFRSGGTDIPVDIDGFVFFAGV